MDAKTPTIVAITKCDTLGSQRDWPAENHLMKAAQIKETVQYFACILKVGKSQQINLNSTIKGISAEELKVKSTSSV